MKYSFLIPVAILIALISYMMSNETPVFTVESEPIILKEKEGEWRIDSVIGQNNYFNREFIYFIDNTFWRFRSDACPMLIDSCLLVRNDSVFKGDDLKYVISVVDSNFLKLKSTSGTTFLIESRRKNYSSKNEFKKNKEEFLKRDSLIRLTVGWWKLKSATFKPIKLVNNSNLIEDFTLHLSNNGDAVFYVNHKVNATEDYGWTTGIGALSFSRGCIVSSSEIVHLEKNKMVFLLDGANMEMDTLELIRCKPLK